MSIFLDFSHFYVRNGTNMTLIVTYLVNLITLDYEL